MITSHGHLLENVDLHAALEQKSWGRQNYYKLYLSGKAKNIHRKLHGNLATYRHNKATITCIQAFDIVLCTHTHTHTQVHTCLCAQRDTPDRCTDTLILPETLICRKLWASKTQFEQHLFRHVIYKSGLFMKPNVFICQEGAAVSIH